MSKTVELVVYRGGQRVVIGEAKVEDDGVVTCLIEDQKFIDDMHLSVAGYSIGWMHPAALAKDWRGGTSLSDIIDTPLEELTVTFKKPLIEELR